MAKTALRFKRSSSLRWPVYRKGVIETDKTVIGFLAFEISALMSRLIQLWNRLQDKEFTRVKEELSNSIGIRILVSEDGDFLMKLFLKDIVEDLQYVTKSITIFGSKCSDAVIHEFERFVRDPINNDFEWYGWQYRWKKMEKRMKKMERFVGNTSELSRELEVLANVERNMKRFPSRFDFSRGKFLKYKQRALGQRRHVEDLKELTPWRRSFDYILRLFMRSIITIIERIKLLFGIKEMPILDESKKTKSIHQNHRIKLIESRKPSQFSLITPFKGCTDSGENGSDSPIVHGCRPIRNSDEINRSSNSPIRINGGLYSISSFFSKEISSNFSTPSTLGAVSLDIHYAKMIIIIEKFASAPQLIGVEERDDLFNMLPARMRRCLRSRMKSSSAKTGDQVLATEWKSEITRILEWLAPMAHNMEKWHCERSFEKPYVVVSKSPALLMETLHYADKEKTEAAVMDLLVALNNVCNASEGLTKRFQRFSDECFSRKEFDFLAL